MVNCFYNEKYAKSINLVLRYYICCVIFKMLTSVKVIIVQPNSVSFVLQV